MGDVTLWQAMMTKEYDRIRTLVVKRMRPLFAEDVRRDLTYLLRCVKEELEKLPANEAYVERHSVLDAAIRRYVNHVRDHGFGEEPVAERAEDGSIVFKMKMPDLPARRVYARGACFSSATNPRAPSTRRRTGNAALPVTLRNKVQIVSLANLLLAPLTIGAQTKLSLAPLTVSLANETTCTRKKARPKPGCSR